MAKCPKTKKTLRSNADDLWSAAVKQDWAHKCSMCGNTEALNSHHLIPRQHTTYRYDLKNGCCLCVHCHQFNADRSPHQHAAGWLQWLHAHHPTFARWYCDTTRNLKKQPPVTKDIDFYCDVIWRLKDYVEEDVYLKIVGPRFADYLEEVNNE